MSIVNKQAIKKNATRGKFLLLLTGLFILTISWKKESKASPTTTANTIKPDSTILLAALKTTRGSAIQLTNNAPSEITAPEGQLRARAQLQAYMDTLIISPAATIGLKRDAKAVNNGNSTNGQDGKAAGTNKAAKTDNLFNGGTTITPQVKFPPDIPSDPDF